MTLPKENKYFAFISYKREDEEWAIWLQHELEYYHLPSSLNGRDDLPKEFRPVFRDIDELKAGNLPQQIYDALASSLNLIVVCSSRAANSRWVNKEIDDFIEIGMKRGINNLDRVFPFIVEGIPHAKDETQECFPKILRDLPSDYERIGGNVNESGRDKAFIKVMAGMLPKVDFDMLWNRYERDKAEEERIKREERNKLLISQSRFIAEKASNLLEDGDSYLAKLLLLEALPKEMNKPNRPFVPEAGMVFRKVYQHNTAILRGHILGVNTAVYSPDGKYIASASDDNTIRIWDTHNGIPLIILNGHLSQVNSVVFNPSGNLIASASDDKTIRIWDVTSGKTLRIIKGHNNAVKSVAFSPQGDTIVSASQDFTIRIWDTKTGKSKRTLKGHNFDIESVAFDPSGKFIISASWDNSIRIWDIDLGKEVYSLEDVPDIVLSSTFSPDGKHIASSLWDNTVLLWNYEKGEAKNKKVLKGHKGMVNKVAFSFDSQLIVSASSDSTIRIWNVNTGKAIKTLYGHLSEVKSASFSPDGKNILSASSDNTIRIWDYKNEDSKLFIKEKGGIDSVVISPKGEYIALIPHNNSVKVLDTKTKKSLRSLKGHNDIVCTIAFSPDGNHILSSSLDGTIRIWDIRTGKALKVFKVHFPKVETTNKVFSFMGFEWKGINDTINSASYSPDGKCIVLALSDNTIRIWNSKTGKELRKFSGTSSIHHVVFSPQGNRIASAQGDQTIRIWDVNNCDKELMVLKGHFSDVQYIDFNIDGSLIASASNDKTVRLWDANTGEEKFNLSMHTGIVNSVHFSPDGACIISASQDGTIILWDTASGKQLYTFDGHKDSVNSAIFCPDGNCIISASSDGTIRFWNFPPLQDLIDQTRERFKGRALTAEERRMYYLE